MFIVAGTVDAGDREVCGGFYVVNDQIADGTDGSDIIQSTNSVPDLDETSSYQAAAPRCGAHV